MTAKIFFRASRKTDRRFAPLFPTFTTEPPFQISRSATAVTMEGLGSVRVLVGNGNPEDRVLADACLAAEISCT